MTPTTDWVSFQQLITHPWGQQHSERLSFNISRCIEISQTLVLLTIKANITRAVLQLLPGFAIVKSWLHWLPDTRQDKRCLLTRTMRPTGLSLTSLMRCPEALWIKRCTRGLTDPSSTVSITPGDMSLEGETRRSGPGLRISSARLE